MTLDSSPIPIRQMLAWPAAVIFMVTSILLAILGVTRPVRVVERLVEQEIEVPVELRVEVPILDVSRLEDEDRRTYETGVRLRDAPAVTSRQMIFSSPHPTYRIRLALDDDLDTMIGRAVVEQALLAAMTSSGIQHDEGVEREAVFNMVVLGSSTADLVVFGSLEVHGQVIVAHADGFGMGQATLHSDWALRVIDDATEVKATILELTQLLCENLVEPDTAGFRLRGEPLVSSVIR